MKRNVLRILLGAGYVFLLTILLLYQSGAFGRRREWYVAVLGTLLLGIALAVVLTLYLRVSDQLKWREENGGTETAFDHEQEGGEKKPAVQKNSNLQNPSAGSRSYEEIYAHFIMVMENRSLSERELEVAWLLYRGYTNRQIGETLYIAETTVKKHVSHIYQKLDVQSRKEFRAFVQTTAVPGSAPSPVPSQTDLRG